MAADRSAARRPSPAAPSSGRALTSSGAGRGSAELDRIIHDRIRLGIVSALAAAPTLTFIELRTILGTTDGNLSVHARKLEDAGYVACTKSFEARVPRTEYRLTSAGKAALERYLSHMEDLIRIVKSSEPGEGGE
jgi:DNA-binding transcriptional ArsR family regulator